MNDKRLILEHGCFEKLRDKSLVVPFVCPVCSCRFDAEYNRRSTSIEHFHGWKKFWYDGYSDNYRYVSRTFCPECNFECTSYREPCEPSPKYLEEV